MPNNRVAGAPAPFVLYLAVLPVYRQACIDELKRQLGDSVLLYAGNEHTDPTVRTGISEKQYTHVRNRFFLGRRILLQTGSWLSVLRANTAVLDLNPRCLSVWILTVARKLLRRRTLHWGHLYPRAGRGSRTDWLRKFLRKLGDGTILYGYASVRDAREDVPDLPVWVAPNSLYPRQELEAIPQVTDRRSVVYVGRLVAEKKVDVLVRAFAASRARLEGCMLRVVGSGDQRSTLARLAVELGCQDSVHFLGTVTDTVRLREIYSESFRAVSPGYAGLSLTQSLGFGVSVLVSRNERHSPEIELERFGGVTFFDSDDDGDLTRALDSAWEQRSDLDTERTSLPVIRLYSAEAMADGLVDALLNRTADRQLEDW